MVGVDLGELDPHELTDDAFLDEVHSFQFWFDSVEGYLSQRHYGHREDTPEAALDDAERDRLITTLCNYCVGETAALEAAGGLVPLAPSRNANIFKATPVVDEARHLEVFLHRLGELGVTNPELEIERRANPALVDFKGALLDLVSAGDWMAAVFAQNVILETMEYTVFRFHATSADPVTAEVLTGVISDERRHAGFGESDLGRRLLDEPSARPRLREVKHGLDRMVLGVFESAMTDVGVGPDERPQLANEYLHTVERLGLL